MSTFSTAGRRPGHARRPTLAATAVVLDGLFAALLAAFLLTFAVTGGPGPREDVALIVLFAPLGLGAIAAIAGGVLAAVGLARERPRSRLGRLALVTTALPYALLVPGAALAALGVDRATAFAVFTAPGPCWCSPRSSWHSSRGGAATGPRSSWCRSRSASSSPRGRSASS